MVNTSIAPQICTTCLFVGAVQCVSYACLFVGALYVVHLVFVRYLEQLVEKLESEID